MTVHLNRFGAVQPDYIAAYLDAHAAAYPDTDLPVIWARQNGWVHLEPLGCITPLSVRPSWVRYYTEKLKQGVAPCYG